MPACPHCRHQFRVLADEDDGQHGCPRCGYTGHEDEDEELLVIRECNETDEEDC